MTASVGSKSADSVEEEIEKAADPSEALLAAWNSGRIVDREVAVQSLTKLFPPGADLPRAIDAMVAAAALDADMNVRELALGFLRGRNHPAFLPLAAAQLRDVDPLVRWLGLNHVSCASAAMGVPTVVRLLQDPDPLVTTMSIKLLERWSGENFGVKLSEIGVVENERTGLQEYRPGSEEKARAGASRAQAWWAVHSGEYGSETLEVGSRVGARVPSVPAADFRLRTLEGKGVRLSDFRGKVVLINFWTTWCTACVSEMPALVALQNRHESDLAILGVSLDFADDSHGHSTVDESSNTPESAGGQGSFRSGKKALRSKIARTAEARGLNYPVLVDERNEVGVLYNGGELPTTVIVDAQGNLRRRFVGTRSLQIFEAMIAEARQPAAPGAVIGDSASARMATNATRSGN